MRWGPQAHYAHRYIVPFRVLCAIRTRLRSHWWFHCTLFCVQLFASRASSRCKHDMGALSWLNVETVERTPTPLFGRLVRYSAHGPLFERLLYVQTTPALWHTCKNIRLLKTPFCSVLQLRDGMLYWLVSLPFQLIGSLFHYQTRKP